MIKGFIKLDKRTPVIDALFFFNELSHVEGATYCFIIKKITWAEQLAQMESIIKLFKLEIPLVPLTNPIDYIDKLVLQMINHPNFNQQSVSDMIYASYDMFYSNYVTSKSMFKLALVFDDEHGLSELSVPSKRICLTRSLNL